MDDKEFLKREYDAALAEGKTHVAEIMQRAIDALDGKIKPTKQHGIDYSVLAASRSMLRLGARMEEVENLFGSERNAYSWKLKRLLEIEDGLHIRNEQDRTAAAMAMLKEENNETP